MADGTLVYAVNGDYRLVPNWNVKNYMDRLRECDAVRAMQFLTKHNVHPGQAEVELKKNLSSVRIINLVVNVPQKTYEFKFPDNTILRWINDLGAYAVQYPATVRAVFIPVSIPKYMDAISTIASEDNLIKEIEDRRFKQSHPYSDYHGGD